MFESFKLVDIAPLILPVLGFEVLNEFQSYREKHRSEASVKALVKLSHCINYVKAITEKKYLYEYKKYYPQNIPETSDELTEKIAHPERPSRLIYNKVEDLKNELGEYTVQIGGNEAKELLELLDSLAKLSNSLASYITVEIKDDPNFFMDAQKQIQEDIKKLENIRNKAITLLDPIVQGKKYRTKRISIIAAYLFFLFLFIA